MSVGGPYPGFFALRAFTASLPVSLSNTTATLPSPPSRQMSKFLYTSGCPLNPHSGGFAPESFGKFFDHTTLPVPASRQYRSPIAPSAYTLPP